MATKPRQQLPPEELPQQQPDATVEEHPQAEPDKQAEEPRTACEDPSHPLHHLRNT